MYARNRRPVPFLVFDRKTKSFIFCLVSAEYFCNLDHDLLRLDREQRPELMLGTVDFAVPEKYWASQPLRTLSMPYYSPEPPPTGPRQPMPINYVFAFDVSHDAVQSGVLQTACSCLLTVLFGGVDPEGIPIESCFPPDSQLAIFTFDRTLHFYDLSVRNIPLSAPR